jgi:hypothetical protein
MASVASARTIGVHRKPSPPHAKWPKKTPRARFRSHPRRAITAPNRPRPASIPIARGTTCDHLPRLRALALLGRRRTHARGQTANPASEKPAQKRVAVGTRVSSHAPRPDPYVRLSRIRLVWGFLCQGCITLLFCCFILKRLGPRRARRQAARDGMFTTR